MRKYQLLTIILLILPVIFVGCKKANIEEESQISEDINNIENLKEDLDTIEDYFPFKENTIMDYEGIGNEFAEQTTFVEYIKDNRAQIKVFNPGTVVVKVLEYNEGELREIFSEGEFYHVENMLSISGETSDVLLKEPLKSGNSWTISGGHKRAITGVDVDIETPYKSYKALEVVTELGDGIKLFDYYVKNVGHVASIYKDGEFVVETLLKEINNSPYKTDMRFYYPLYKDMQTVYIDREIAFNTNDSIENILAYNFRNPGSEKLISDISKNTKINSIKLERGNGVVRVDFSEELITDMNAGSGLEAEIVKSITNTLGNYYGVEKVYISVEGKPYSSGHIEIREDEFFEVENTDVEEFKE